MLAAVQKEMLPLSTPSSVCSEAEIFSLAALSAVALETHVGTNTRKGEKPHQGVARQNRALHLGHEVCNSTTALGVSWWWWSGTASGAGVTYDYDAFGNIVNETGSTPNNYLFAGEQFDPALSLYYNRARYLNTATGRFWSMDTYEGVSTSPLSLHKYLYASGNPVNSTDASGNQDTEEELAGEADGEIVEGAADEEASVGRKALNAQVVDIYDCAKWQLFRVPYHSWPYANLPGNQGFRYDIGANQVNGQVLTGPVPGGLDITETTLDAVQQDANSKFTKQASLSFLTFLEWQSFVVGTALLVGTGVNALGESVTQFEREYGLGPPYLSPDAGTQIGDAINCIIFTKLAIAEAQKLQGAD